MVVGGSESRIAGISYHRNPVVSKRHIAPVVHQGTFAESANLKAAESAGIKVRYLRSCSPGHIPGIREFQSGRFARLFVRTHTRDPRISYLPNWEKSNDRNPVIVQLDTYAQCAHFKGAESARFISPHCGCCSPGYICGICKSQISGMRCLSKRIHSRNSRLSNHTICVVSRVADSATVTSGQTPEIPDL
jgi:hypothetical protein